MASDVRRVPATELDQDCAESWERLTDDSDMRGVDACLITAGEVPYWSVGVAVAEFLRDDPAEADLRQQMAAALRAVGGADSVWEEDRETWGVTGTPSGQALARAGRLASAGPAPSVARESGPAPNVRTVNATGYG